ncbi:MAG: sigma-70 family RNA polymerase sigma factor [Oscillospiraceae bacterium]|nr:sigma-70 family RNA polymerase sigma factor [Oscillospiraceae bacterium]
MNDNDILALYWDRDDRAIAETDLAYGAYCRSIAKNILSTDEDTEESVNDTYLAAWNSIPPKKPEVLRTFLGRLTRNISINRWRSCNAEKRGGGQFPLALEELEGCVPDRNDPEQSLEARELGQAIDKFLRGLPLRDCNIFLRRYWHLDSIADIAARYSISASNVKTILFRTRAKLKNYLEGEGISI